MLPLPRLVSPSYFESAPPLLSGRLVDVVCAPKKSLSKPMSTHRVALALICLALLSYLLLPASPPTVASDESAFLKELAGENLAPVLHLQWTRDYPALKPA